MSMIDKIKTKAKKDVKRIVLPEGDEVRTVEAASILKKEGLAEPVLLGAPDKVKAQAETLGVDISGIEIVDPETSPKAGDYAAKLYELRKAKGVTEEGAAELVKDPMYYGIMMVQNGDADGLVSGAVHTTGDMLRPALQIIKTKPEMKVVSSSFLMDCPNKELGEDGLLVYADCVVMPEPTSEELAYIAIATADPKILGYHDFMIHCYGPSRMFASIHLEFDYRENILDIHDIVDNIEYETKKQTGVNLVVHMDPIDSINPETIELKNKVNSIVESTENVISFHDFRIVKGPTHTNVLFDLVLSLDTHNDTAAKKNIVRYITDRIKLIDPRYNVIIKTDVNLVYK